MLLWHSFDHFSKHSPALKSDIIANMRIFVSGIGGVAMGPLAMLARDMGHQVYGSNNVSSDLVEHMVAAGFDVSIGQQDDHAVRGLHETEPIDWFIYTAALPKNHPELEYAKSVGIRCSKRDGFINELLEQKNLQMIAVSGTHGKTNTTGMVIWCLKQAGIPISYSVGSRISFGEFGEYDPSSQYFVYEADEFDRNMLKFEPAISIITSIDYDHPDTYATKEDYQEAFAQFIENTSLTFLYRDAANLVGATNQPGVHTIDKNPGEDCTTLPGIYIRQNARLVLEMLTSQFGLDRSEIGTWLNSYPGTSRRMECVTNNLYSDYAHHPAEIRSALQQALEINPRVVVVYQPHQNIRQHEIKDLYSDCFSGAESIYWLSTYLSREANSELPVLSPDNLISTLVDPSIAQPAEMNQSLAESLRDLVHSGVLVLALSAGDLDEWIRHSLASSLSEPKED
jgi:UDP-N-acetylmuramate--alanine ligase